MDGRATATPSTALTRSATEESSEPRWRTSGPCPPAAESSVALRTTTSMWLLATAKRSAKLARRVSERASVPARKATPRNTASTVPARRRLLARSRRVVMRSTSASQSLEPVEDGAGGRALEGVDEAAVGQEQGGVGVAGGHGVVGDHDHRLAELGDGPAEEAEDLGPGTGVEVAGGLVGED